MNSLKQPQSMYGLVGIFDALGAKNFGPSKVASYIESQEQILRAVEDKASNQAESGKLSTPKNFTFNDTIVIALGTDKKGEYNAIKGFARIVRRFLSYSLTKSLFFRGAIAIGDFTCSEEQNLIMGNAVTDAASWYEQPEFIGAIATPKASMIIQKHIIEDADPPNFLLFEVEVLCKKGKQRLFAINWPKAFYISGLRPEICKKGKELSCLLHLLSANEVPIGTEAKYTNTINFFKESPVQKKMDHESNQPLTPNRQDASSPSS